MLDKKTSMLYNADTMKNKTNIPENLLPSKNYSFWTDMKVNGWMIAAVLTAFVSDMLLHSNVPRYFHLHEKDWPVVFGLLHPHSEDWPVMMRVIIELAPVLLSLLWARSVARWIRSMDELHRLITLEACLFAVIGTLLVITVWHRLSQAGILEAIFQPPSPPLERWDFRQLAHLDINQFVLTIGLLSLFYLLGHSILNRRYK
jgi:multisubunit Na+/H+ antiporter MnhF subunit